MKSRFLRTLLLPAIVAFPVLLIILFFTDADVKRHKLIMEKEILLDSRGKYEYSDFDGDGHREYIRVYNLETNAGIIAYKEGETLYEAWALPGFWNRDPEFLLEDTDKDGIQELFGLTMLREDSLFIHRVPLAKRQFEMESRFLTVMGRHEGRFDARVILLGLEDMTGDGHEEVLVQVSAGFTLQPRAIYAWDRVNDTLIRSPFAGLNPKHTASLVHTYSDMAGPLLFVSTTATDNYHEPVVYHDSASYATVYKSNLEYLFDPVYIGGPQSMCHTLPYWQGDELMVLAFCYDRRAPENRIFLKLLDTDGRIMAEKATGLNIPPFQNIYVDKQWIFSKGLEGETDIMGIGPDLDILIHATLEGNYTLEGSLNVDHDQAEELILVRKDGGSLGILQDDLHTFTHIQLPRSIKDQEVHVSMVNSEERKTLLCIQSEEYIWMVQLQSNRLYSLRFLYYLGLLILLTAVLVFLQWLFSLAARRRYEREENLLNYQLQSVMNQLNPHFTFNAINSIGDAILSGRKEEAFEYFTKLSDLIRKSMKNAIQPYKTLQEEVDFVREYLEIESYRFGERLDWSFKLDPDVDTSLVVPKMLIHIFAENSIKHGLFHLEDNGKLEIHIRPSGDVISISIFDNGVGFDRAFEIEGYRGEGLQIMDKYIKLYNQQEKHLISYEITDLLKTKQVPGTKILIRITSK